MTGPGARAEKAERWAKKYDAQRQQAEQALCDVYAAARAALTGMGVDPDESPEHAAVLDGMAAGLDVSCTCGIGGSELDGPYPHAVHCGLEPPDARLAPADRVEAPTRDDVAVALHDAFFTPPSEAMVGMDLWRHTADGLIERGWLPVRDDEGGQR